jgi:Skp family chaperone for outer membrane proteins
MKKFFRAAILGAVFAVALAFGAYAMGAGGDAAQSAGSMPAAGGAKIGVMDLVRVTGEAKVMKSLNGQKDAVLKKIKSEVDAKRKEFEKKEQELSSKQAIVTEEVFMREAAKFRADLVEYDRQTAARVEGVEKAYVDALKKVQRDYLDAVAGDIGRKRGFDIVLNAQAALVLDSSLDITAEVIEGLDSKVKELELKVK